MVVTLVLYSPFETQERVFSRWQKVLFDINSINPISENNIFFANEEAELGEVLEKFSDGISALILIIGSGGTERLGLNAIHLTSCPVVLVANDQVNSLAAAIEINAIAKHLRPLKFVFAQNPTVQEQIKDFLIVSGAINKINGSRFGIVGGPSSWLISSDGITSFGKFKTSMISIGIERLLEIYRKTIPADKASITARILEECGSNTIPKSDVLEAAGVYLAMMSLVEEEMLDGLTIRCFDLLQHKITACLGMAMANNGGIVASCEGDLHASFCMLLGSYLTGGAVWMANPSSVSIASNTLTLAHCTVPFSMLEKDQKPNLDTHMESKLSMAVEGSLRKQEVTIFRTLGNFSGIYAVTGKIVETNMGNRSLCRTQAVIELDSNVSEWMQDTPGNHQVLTYRNILHLLKDFCLLSGISLVSN